MDTIETSGGWDVETDLLVFGSGAGGLAASLYGAKKGLRVLLCEKSAQLGGTTATSGGMLWVPGNAQARRAGIKDSVEKAREYLRGELGNYYREDLVDAFLDSGAEALRELETDTEMVFDLSASPDYHPEQPGGIAKGRSVGTRAFDGRKLGADFALVRPPMRRLLVLGGMMVGPDEIPAFLNPFASVAKFRHVMRRLVRYAIDRLSHNRGTQVSNGNALVARFLYSLRQKKAEIWTDAPLVELIRAGDRVTGAVVCHRGKTLRVRAKNGVVLATGGFPHNQQLRNQISAKFPHSHTLAFEGNTGDGITAATQVGAAIDTDLYSPVLWTPASTLREADGSEATVIYGYLDRGRPGIIAVDPDGKRFVNESNSYHDIVMAMYEQGRVADSRFYFVCDQQFVHAHGLGALRPWPWTPSLKRYANSGYLVVADTLSELARKIGVDAENLAETVRKHNGYAATGIDLEFAKGSTAYNRVWGHERASPNPNLTPIDKPPFVALRIIPASLGTVIGLKSDGNARVLDGDGQPIPGLFACGNELASAMRGFYPGGGVTLGPAVVFAYRAVQFAASQRAL